MAAEIGSREYWNPAHETGHAGALSGSPAPEVIKHHQLDQQIKTAKTVLDIGVGLGNMSRYLHERGLTVDALDVADAAEKTVKPFVRRFYLAERIEELPAGEYDLAISHIVAQHMNESDLRRQIAEVFRALKPGGLFSLHMAGADKLDMNNWDGPVRPGYDGAMCRLPDYAVVVAQMATEGKAKVMLLGHRMRWPQFGSYWYWLWIEKNAND